MLFQEFTILPGSIRRLYFGHRISAVEFINDIDVTIQVRRKKSLEAISKTGRKGFLTRSELEEEYGASPRDLSVVLAFAEHFGLEVMEIEAGKRTVTLRGNSTTMSNAFKVHVFETHSLGQTSRCRVGPIFIPTELSEIITGVFGLDNRPQAINHLRFASGLALEAKPNAFDGEQLAGIYDFPISDGRGQTIALIELGGGFLHSDIKKFFTALNLNVPKIDSVSVNGAKNRPYLDKGADTEVALDIQVAGAVAPGAAIVVYFAPNDDQSFLKAILTAIHDEINKPSIISISWGAAECAWTEQQMLAMDEAFKSAAALGISVFCAAGDNGASDNIYDEKSHVDFPASSPHAIACGGTSLKFVGGVRQEIVWNNGDGGATGGGISNFFPVPDYQRTVKMPQPINTSARFPGRGVPDVSAVADPYTGYAVLVHGHWTVVGGTSAVAPLYAGLTARLNARLSTPVGFVNTAIYKDPNAGLFNDILSGNNSVDRVVGYESNQGWDAVTGWGTPNGLSILNFFDKDK